MTDDADGETVDADRESDPAADGEASNDPDGMEGPEETLDEEVPNGRAEGVDDTVPNVELGLYQLSVRVSGRSDDDLQTVEASAQRLMDYLIDRAGELEERPDDRGLG